MNYTSSNFKIFYFKKINIQLHLRCNHHHTRILYNVYFILCIFRCYTGQVEIPPTSMDKKTTFICCLYYIVFTYVKHTMFQLYIFCFFYLKKTSTSCRSYWEILNWWLWLWCLCSLIVLSSLLGLFLIRCMSTYVISPLRLIRQIELSCTSLR